MDMAEGDFPPSIQSKCIFSVSDILLGVAVILVFVFVRRLFGSRVIPQCVQSLKASLDPTTKSSVTLTWSPPGNCTRHDITHYHIRYKQKSDTTAQYTDLPPVSHTNVQIQMFTGDGRNSGLSLRPYTSYVFEVRAEGQANRFGEWSSVEYYIGPVIPLCVQNLEASLDPLTKSSVTLTWSPPRNCIRDDDVICYHIRYKQKSDTMAQYTYLSPISCTLVQIKMLTCDCKDNCPSLRPLTSYVFEVRAEGQFCKFGEWSSVECYTGPVIPLRVQNLKVSLDCTQSSVTLTWCPPGNCTRINYAVRYHIQYKEKFDKTAQNKVLPFTRSVLKKVFRCDGKERSSSLRPLTPYVFEVRAEGQGGVFGEWSSVEWFTGPIVPQCVQSLKASFHPGCYSIKPEAETWPSEMLTWTPDTQPSVTLTWSPPGNCTNDDVTHYHIRYKEKFDTTAQFTDLRPVSHTNVQIQVFTGDGKDKAGGLSLRPSTSYVFEVRAEGLAHQFGERSSVECFTEGKFNSTWDPKKGDCPTIFRILAIYNPEVDEKFQRFIEKLPPFDRISKSYYFHGTKLKCKLAKSMKFCDDSDCGVCGIAKKGFVSERISKGNWQRLGQAFYFAPNSSKSHDYCLMRSGYYSSCTPLNGSYWGMLICEVAPGRKYSFRPNRATQLVPQAPPQGYHSLYGQSKSDLLESDLNYDELAVFSEDAICPRYIVLYM